MPLDFVPVPVTHLRRFSAGFSLLEKRIDAAVSVLIYYDRLGVASRKEKLSRLIEELIAAGELATGNAFFDKFLNRCGQDNVHGSFLHKSYLAFYAVGDGMSSLKWVGMQRALTSMCFGLMLLCMRTTIDLDDLLLSELKQEAARRGSTLRELVDDLLRQAMAAPEPKAKYHFNWKPHRGGRIQPGVRLDDRNSLFDLMDGR